jgi:hypothetical protein
MSWTRCVGAWVCVWPTKHGGSRARCTYPTPSHCPPRCPQIITLNSVSIIVAEFIPFGANQIVQMNQNLGSTERVQGGFFTALIDNDSSGGLSTWATAHP